MTTHTQVATILQKSFGQEEGLLVLEYFEGRLPPDVARQRDISQTEAALRLETEQVRTAIRQSEAATDRRISETEAALRLEIEKVRREIEKVRADLSVEIEKVRADLTVEIEKARVEIERSQAAQTRWAFLFWLSQIVVLGGLMYQLLR